MGVKCCNCFREITAGGVCPHCGYDGRKEDGFPLALKPGTILHGEFELGRVLGQGGFGITYLAQHIKSGKIVAVKEFYPKHLAGRTQRHQVQPQNTNCVSPYDSGKLKFMQEAQTIAKLSGNRVVVEIYSYFEENNTAYFAMEYINGQNFAKYVESKGGKMAMDDVRELLLPAIIAMGEVHNAGVVHRDISPGNIMVETGGRARLLDFGSARTATGNETNTVELTVNHGYSPPEMYNTTSKRDQAVDIYSMGAVIYSAVTGQIPQMSIERMFEDKLRSPAELGVQISNEDNATIMKAMSIKPSDRFSSMEEFAKALTKDVKYVAKAYEALGAADWETAEKYISRAKENEPMNPLAYIAAILCSLKLRNRDELVGAAANIREMPDYELAYAYADIKLKKEMENWGGRASANLVSDAYEALNKQDWVNAEIILVRALRENPCNPDIYIGRLLCELKLQNREQLKNTKIDLKEMPNFKLAYVYASDSLKKEMDSWGKKKSTISVSRKVVAAVAAAAIAVVVLGVYFAGGTKTKIVDPPYRPESTTTVVAAGPKLLLKNPEIKVDTKASDYNYKRLNVKLMPNTTYTVTIDEIEVLEGSTVGVSIKLYDFADGKQGKTLDSEIINISKTKEGLSCTLRTPATSISENSDLIVYSGVAGKTAGVAVSYKGLAVHEGKFADDVNKPISADKAELLAVISNVDIKAKDSNYNYIKLGQALEPNQIYTVSFGGIFVTEGRSEAIGIRVYDFGVGKEGQEVDSALVELFGSGKGNRCVLRTGDSISDNTEIVLYSGIHGKTKGVGVSYQDIRIYKGVYTGE